MSSGKAKQFRRAYKQMGYSDEMSRARGNEDFKTYKELTGTAKKEFNELLRQNTHE